MNAIKMIALVLFFIWQCGALIGATYEQIQAKKECIKNQGFISGWLFCEYDWRGRIDAGFNYIKHLGWPVTIFSSKDDNIANYSSENIPADVIAEAVATTEATADSTVDAAVAPANAADADVPLVEDVNSNNINARQLKPFENEKAPALVASINDISSFTYQLPIKIRQGMEYAQARKILIDSGWQTVNANRTPNGQPVCFLVASMQDWSFQDNVACNYNEIEVCSGTGMGFCKMIFYDGDNSFLSVVTAGGRPPDALIHNWSKEKNYEANVIALDEISNYEN
jgi:hypothetical protein